MLLRENLSKFEKSENARNRKKMEKICPKCGYVPVNYYAKLKKECSKCATRFTWREVKEDVTETTE
jgi:heterodisulfide reductase subunit B